MSTSPMEIEARLDGPAMEPPPGGTSNFIDPPILMVPYVITLVLCLIMSTLALAMRLYTKFCIIRKNGWEDCEMRKPILCSHG